MGQIKNIKLHIVTDIKVPGSKKSCPCHKLNASHYNKRQYE